MNKAERAALATLLDSVGLGFTKCLAECKLLRAYLQRTQPRLAVKAASTPVVITQALDPGIDLGPPVIGGIKNPHADMGAPSPRTRKAPAKKAKAKR